MGSYFKVLGAMALTQRKFFDLKPTVFKAPPREKRREMCEALLKTISSERRKKQLTNLVALKDYAEGIKALQREL